MSGLSAGGGMTWWYLNIYPNKLAAASPMAADFNKTENCASTLNYQDVPVWVFTAQDDATVSLDRVLTTVNAHNACNPKIPVKLTVFPSGGHVIDDEVYGLDFLNTGLPEYDLYDQSVLEWYSLHQNID